MSMKLTNLDSPRYVISEKKIKENLDYFKFIKEKTSCKILLATKAFSCFSVYPLISSVLDGTANSSLYEAKLTSETFGKDTHIYSPAYCESTFSEITKYANCLIFNSINQLKGLRKKFLSIHKLV